MARKVTLNPTPWHPGYPFRRPSSRSRKLLSLATLLILVTLIAAYWFVTDSARVRAIAEYYLAEATGGEVTVGRGRLSIFEGLRLDDVTIRVPGSDKHEPPLFTAATVYLRLPMADLARRDFSSTSIIAVEPKVTLISDTGGRTWNFQKLARATSATTRTTRETPIGRITLPQLVLRGGRIEYVERIGSDLVSRGSVVVEGNLIPEPARPDYLTFAVTARGSRDKPGTSLTGWAYLSTGQVSARLQNFDLGEEYLHMLPAPVRRWWEQHEIAGNVEIPELSIEPVPEGSTTRPFRVVALFRGGAMSLLPEELQGYDADFQGDRGKPGPPVRVDDVRGTLVFTESGIELQDMSLMLEGSRIAVSGSLGGYSPGSPLTVRVRCDDLHLPENPAFVSSLPPLPRDIYDSWSPSGYGSFDFQIERNAEGRISTNGRLDIRNGTSAFDGFPYRVHDITGSIVVTSVAPGQTRLEARNIRGRGNPTGPNRNADLRIDGFMFPLEGGSEVDFQIRGDHVVADHELIAAMPRDVQDVIQRFDDTGRGFPEFGGGFSAHVYRAPGPVSRWKWPIDVRIASGTGRFRDFPYPLENVTGRIVIESGLVRLEQMRSTRGDAHLTVDGKVHLREPEAGGPDFDLDLAALNIPIDHTLIHSVAADRRPWLDALGPAGLLDLKGRIEGPQAAYTLFLTVRDASATPLLRAPLPEGTPRWSAENVTAELRLTPTDLTIVRASGLRLGNPMHLTGRIDFAQPEPQIRIDASASRLPIDPALRSVLDDAARAGFDSVQPEGAADVTIALRPDAPPVYHFHPLGMAITPAVLPLRVTDLRGEVTIRGTDIILSQLSARRGDARLTLTGTGSTRPTDPWLVTFSADQLTIDAPLRKALPQLIRDAAESLALDGLVDLRLREFRYTAQAAATSPTTATETPTPRVSADFDLQLIPRHLTASLGVPVLVTSGQLDLRGSVRDDRLATVTGSLHFPTGEISGRAFRDLRTRISKTPDRDGMLFDAFSGTLADGELSGFAAIAFPPGESTRYGMDLSLLNADVSVLVGKLADTPLSGRMSASLTLQGTVDNPASRRGRGDLSVTGERMARVPVLLGLVQIANLSLPGGTSFNNATARYNMDGPRVNLEQLVLRSPGMQIDGAGMIDLDSRQVRLSLWSVASSDLPKVPIFSDLADRTRRELLQVQIRGTIDNPKVGASSFDSFTTTVDEVFRASGRNDLTPPRR